MILSAAIASAVSLAGSALLLWVIFVVFCRFTGFNNVRVDKLSNIAFQDVTSSSVPATLPYLPEAGDALVALKDTFRVYIQDRFDALNRLRDEEAKKTGVPAPDSDDNMFRSRLFGQDWYFLRSPTVFRRVMLGEGKLVVPETAPSAHVLVGEGSVVTQQGDEHRRARRVLANGFNEKALASYAPFLVTRARECLRRWCDQGTNDVYEDIKCYVFQTICSILFGDTFYDRKGKTLRDAFALFSKALISMPVDLPFTTFGRGSRAREQIMEAIDAEIQDRRKSCPIQNDPCLLKYCLEQVTLEDESSDNYMSVDELKRQLLAILFAGHDTTSTALTQTIAELTQRNDVLDKLFQEQQDAGIVVKDNDITTLAEATMPKSKQILPLHAAVVTEAMRLRPVGFMVVKKSISPIAVGKTHIPAGAMVAVCMSYASSFKLVHMGDGLEFRPERHLGEEGRVLDAEFRARAMPFGLGAHSCIGKNLALMECQAFLLELVRTRRRIVCVGNPPEWRDCPLSQPKYPFCIRMEEAPAKM